MANATLYSSMDAAGPGLRPATGSAAYPAVTRLYGILVACLVTGYGAGATAKPGQGWILVHASLPNGFTLQAPDGVFYVFYKGPNIDATSGSAGTHGCQVYMAESVSSPYTYPPTGTNIRSGDYSSNNSGESARHWISFSNSSYPENKWFLVARGSQVLFFRDSYSWTITGGDSPSGSANNNSAMFFMGNVRLKDLSAPRSGPQCSIVQGGYSAANTVTGGTSCYSNYLGSSSELLNASSDSFGASSAACSRLRDFVSGVVEAGALQKTTASPTKHGGVVMARQAMLSFPADIRLDPVDVWLAGSGSIGYVPGLFHGGRSCHYVTSDLLVAFGRGSGLSDVLVPVEIDGEPYLIIPTGYGSAFVSLLEKYWQ